MLQNGTNVEEVDVLIIGSGLAGASFFRTIADADPNCTILMVDAGPPLRGALGEHQRNIASSGERACKIVPQCTYAYGQESATRIDTALAARETGVRSLTLPGVHLLNSRPEEPSCFPALAASTNVGGMGAHWSCACPRPSGSERISSICEVEMDGLLSSAECLLNVAADTRPGMSATGISRVIEDTLRISGSRPVSGMPSAMRIEPNGFPHYTGIRTVLGSWVHALDSPVQGHRLALRSKTICRQLVLKNDSVIEARMLNIDSRLEYSVRATYVVVAADSIRTPQLLWSSGIRPRALGRYLNEHPVVTSVVRHDVELSTETADLIMRHYGLLWIPFDERRHPYHGQVRCRQCERLERGGTVYSCSLELVLSWFCSQDIRSENRVEFSNNRLDQMGLPAPVITYSYTAHDVKTLTGAAAIQRSLAKSLGTFVANQTPRINAPGQSFHYMGTVRMGTTQDETACDLYSRVANLSNLYVGGNCVIPTRTCCNPTLTTVALAIRSAQEIVRRLGSA